MKTALCYLARPMHTNLRSVVAAALALACASSPQQKPPAGPATPDEAKAFAQRSDGELHRLSDKVNTAEWIKSTYITDDTERNAAWANEAMNGAVTQAITEATRFDGLDLAPETARMLKLLKLQVTLPAPNDPARRAEQTQIAARLEGMYGKGKWCKTESNCLDLQQVEDIMKSSRDEAELRAAWVGWHEISKPMRKDYERLVSLSNAGAKEIGLSDVGQLWRAGYDMTPEALEKDAQRLWAQTRPLYEQLHCYVRGKLAGKYGSQVVRPDGPIPAHLLGNMWSQTWDNIYPLVEPFPGAVNLDIEPHLKAQKFDAIKMAKLAESFFTSLGLDALPKSFWESSLFTKPRDREVVCHASAWDLNSGGDVRIKMCIQIDEENVETLHHELGHVYYSWYRRTLPFLYNIAPNDGFDEAIGDAITHSITPGYLKQLGLIDELPKDEKGLLNVQMKEALARVAFLPFGLLIDQWRWDVFAGKTAPADYNAAWWRLRESIQGVQAPVARSEADFDPGAKYHVPASVPYLRYFFAAILQYQFHRALCKAAGHTGPLHECSIYGNKAAGEKLKAMLSLGASRTWQDALFALSGEREMDAGALLDYFAPLSKWLTEQNAGKQCGWK
jgi:peptidyl-dipeptidase A